MKESFHVISNTHWDREWYQCHEKYLVRLVELTDRLLDLMERKPAYRFVTDGQYALIGDYLAVKPENRERVAALVKQGRLLIGPWYTQPLENIVGGEALVRNLKKGVTESEKLGGAMRFSYEIDEFGHTSQLPQILAGFGIDGVMAWRGVPDFCRSCFRWSAPDGTTAWFFNSNAGYGEATGLPDCEEDYTEIVDGTGIPRLGLKNHVKEIHDLRRKVSDSDEMLWLNGIDHSWAQEDILEICEKIEKLFPEYTVRQSTPGEYAEAVKKDLAAKGIKPDEYKGELMFTNEPVLESTNSLHCRQKRRHYESEKLLVRQVEPFTAAAYLLGGKYPAWGVAREWGYVLENHAHDSLGCCSVDEVFEQVMARYGASISLGQQLRDDSLRYIMSRGSAEPSLWLFNTSDREFSGAAKVVFDVPSGFGGENVALTTPDGKPVPMSVLSSDTNGDVRYNPRLGHPTWGEVGHITAVIDAPAIPAFGAVRLCLVKTKLPTVTVNRQNYYFCRRPGVLENEKLRVEIAPNGTFTLTDKLRGETYPDQLIFTDDGEAANCYVHAEPKNDPRRVTSLGCAAQITTLYDTPLGAAVSIRLAPDIPAGLSEDRTRRTRETEKLEITAVLSLEKDSAFVKIDVHVENRSRNHRLRVLFPFGDRGAKTSESGQAFDEVSRSISWPEQPELAEMPYMTHPMQDYCAVFAGNAGLAVSARGLYEYECTDDEGCALALTLFRSIEVIDNMTFQTTPQYFMHKAQNIGGLDFSLNLIPCGADREEMLALAGASLKPVFAAVNRQTEDSVMPGYVRPDNVLGDVFSALELSGEGLCVQAFKKADSTPGVIVRVRNRLDRPVDGQLRVTLPAAEFTSVYACDLEENRLNKAGQGSAVCFTAGAKKILTFEFVKE